MVGVISQALWDSSSPTRCTVELALSLFSFASSATLAATTRVVVSSAQYGLLVAQSSASAVLVIGALWRLVGSLRSGRRQCRFHHHDLKASSDVDASTATVPLCENNGDQCAWAELGYGTLDARTSKSTTTPATPVSTLGQHATTSTTHLNTVGPSTPVRKDPRRSVEASPTKLQPREAGLPPKPKAGVSNDRLGKAAVDVELIEKVKTTVNEKEREGLTDKERHIEGRASSEATLSGEEKEPNEKRVVITKDYEVTSGDASEQKKTVEHVSSVLSHAAELPAANVVKTSWTPLETCRIGDSDSRTVKRSPVSRPSVSIPTSPESPRIDSATVLASPSRPSDDAQTAIVRSVTEAPAFHQQRVQSRKRRVYSREFLLAFSHCTELPVPLPRIHEVTMGFPKAYPPNYNRAMRESSSRANRPFVSHLSIPSVTDFERRAPSPLSSSKSAMTPPYGSNPWADYPKHLLPPKATTTPTSYDSDLKLQDSDMEGLRATRDSFTRRYSHSDAILPPSLEPPPGRKYSVGAAEPPSPVSLASSSAAPSSTSSSGYPQYVGVRSASLSSSASVSEHDLARRSDDVAVGMPKQEQIELAQDGCPLVTVSRKLFMRKEGTMQVPWRKWDKGSVNSLDENLFMVMSYNLLAPPFCTPQKYPHLDGQYLDWGYRRQRIMEELAYYSADFYCLQEVMRDDYDRHFRPFFQSIGYTGTFESKTRQHVPDGCCIFYNHSRFRLTHRSYIAFADRMGKSPSQDFKTRLAPFANVGLSCTFELRAMPHLSVRVVTTHLHWDPAFQDAKLLQAAMLMEWLGETSTEVPTVLAGDLNSMWGEAVMEFLVNGRVALAEVFGGRDYGRFTSAFPPPPPASSTKPSSRTTSRTSSRRSSLSSASKSPVHPEDGYLNSWTKLAPAYDTQTLPYTNKTLTFSGSIDHILYTSSSLSVCDVLGSITSLPPLPGGEAKGAAVAGDYLRKLPSLPSRWVPSDHLSLTAWFRFGSGAGEEPTEVESVVAPPAENEGKSILTTTTGVVDSVIQGTNNDTTKLDQPSTSSDPHDYDTSPTDTTGPPPTSTSPYPSRSSTPSTGRSTPNPKYADGKPPLPNIKTLEGLLGPPLHPSGAGRKSARSGGGS
ncbi:Glucose-repressible alcohol dehydrogenase transcriptional effector, partial [Borealophlyctis nickersoniae]